MEAFLDETISEECVLLQEMDEDSITIEWTNSPDGAPKQFRHEWFKGNGKSRRKIFPIVYNS